MPYFMCPRCEQTLYTAASKGKCGKCSAPLKRVSEPTPREESNRGYMSVEPRSR